jgi:hypothetical protein
MRAVEQWALIEQGLPEDWEEAQISLVVEDAGAVSTAAAALAPLGPGRLGDELRFYVHRSGSSGPQAVANLLDRLDHKRVWATLALVEARVARPVESQPKRRLVEAWGDAVRALSPGWSDLLCELELDSSDFLPRATLLGAPLNPTRNPEAIALRFRVSAKRGYGAAPVMVARCLERMDEDGITGTLAVLDALSDAENAGTQGPVWRIAGRSQ